MPTTKLKCDLCGKQYKHQAMLDRHMRVFVHKTTPAVISVQTVTPAKNNPNAPTLIKCGKHFIDPRQVSSIREVKDGTLYIVKFKDDPNPEYPCWIKPEDIGVLLAHFNIVEGE